MLVFIAVTAHQAPLVLTRLDDGQRGARLMEGNGVRLIWTPDTAPIYYWSGEKSSELEAFYVSYNGWVGGQPKSWGNPRHGYRCVRVPAPR